MPGAMGWWSKTLVGSVSSLIVWSIHFVAVYTLQAVGCDRAWDAWPVAGTNALTLLLIVVTVPALGVIAWIAWIGWRALRGWRRKGEEGSLDSESIRRRHFLGLLTSILAVVAFFATMMTAVPIVMLPPCG